MISITLSLDSLGKLSRLFLPNFLCKLSKKRRIAASLKSVTRGFTSLYLYIGDLILYMSQSISVVLNSSVLYINNYSLKTGQDGFVKTNNNNT